ncbi:hypothetical protein [Methylobacterium sp. Leaf89]|uniref:hypothetical protein n=1 Tax=Methylobacterium sp. Leaf89 TaxID=1736245 RepID=UPI0006F9D2E3|nr:hypothetical protein [Methylobacterium sp. Leaf89]KQO74729.1 hypothetical protein ASF18_15290 [Methylobacterium sp. Leaf89]
MLPLQGRDRDVCEAEPFAALDNGLRLVKVADRPVVVLFSQYSILREIELSEVEIVNLPDAESFGFARAFPA